MRDFLDAVEKAEQMKQKTEKRFSKDENQPERKPEKKTFAKEKPKSKPKPANDSFGTNKYKPEKKFTQRERKK